jgi:arginine decarboxylase-like protein
MEVQFFKFNCSKTVSGVFHNLKKFKKSSQKSFKKGQIKVWQKGSNDSIAEYCILAEVQKKFKKKFKKKLKKKVLKKVPKNVW